MGFKVPKPFWNSRIPIEEQLSSTGQMLLWVRGAQSSPAGVDLFWDHKGLGRVGILGVPRVCGALQQRQILLLVGFGRGAVGEQLC